MLRKHKHRRLTQLKAICHAQASHAQFEHTLAARDEAQQEEMLDRAQAKVDDALSDWERLQSAGRLDPQFAQAFAALLERSENNAAAERATLLKAQAHRGSMRTSQANAQAQADVASKRARESRIYSHRFQEEERLHALQLLRGSRRRS